MIRMTLWNYTSLTDSADVYATQSHSVPAMRPIPLGSRARSDQTNSVLMRRVLRQSRAPLEHGWAGLPTN